MSRRASHVLHRRASAWYADSLDFSQAIEHSIAAGDVERAAELICDSLSDYLNRGSLATIRSWLHRFSDEQIATSPPLCLAAATVALANGDGALGEHWARIGVKALDDAGATAAGGSLAGAFALVRASLARDGIARMDADAARAAESLSEESPWLAECCLLRGIAAHLGGDHERARAWLDEGARRGAVVAPLVQVLCLAQLTLLLIEEDDWNAGARLVDRARVQVERFGLASYPSVALVPAVCALVEAHRGRVEDARRELLRSTRLLDAVVDFPSWYEAEIRIVLAQTAFRLDDPVSARQRLAEAAAVLEPIPCAPALDAWLRRARSSVDTSTAAVERGHGSDPGGAPDPAVPTHALLISGDRRTARRLREHGPEPGAGRLSQARRQHSTRGGGARAEARPDRGGFPAPRAVKRVRNERNGLKRLA